jgi:CRP/FNR family transcriptional regulator
LIKALRAVPDFADLDQEMLLTIAGCSVNLLWCKDSIVFEEGSSGEALFIVLSGKVQIFEVIDGVEKVVVDVEQGQYFGELSLLLDATHTKSARVIEDAELLSIPKESFEELLDSSEQIKTHVYRRFKERMPEGRLVE